MVLTIKYTLYETRDTLKENGDCLPDTGEDRGEARTNASD